MCCVSTVYVPLLKFVPSLIMFIYCSCSSGYAYRTSSQTCAKCTASTLNPSTFLAFGSLLLFCVAFAVIYWKLEQMKQSSGIVKRDIFSRILMVLGMVRIIPEDTEGQSFVRLVNGIKLVVMTRIKVL